MSGAREPLLPGATLGVLGGGQLGRMFVHAAQAMGYATAVLDEDPASPAGLVSHTHIGTPYLDEGGLAALAAAADAVTTEFENVPAAALDRLAAAVPVAPSGAALAVCQDRAREKAHFAQCGVASAPHAVIEMEADLAVDPALLPGILKTAGLGYDGKGQVRVASLDELAAGWEELGRVRCVLEQRLELAYEVSVVLARGSDGAIVHLPLQENVHRDGILAVTTVPAPSATPAVADAAFSAAERIAGRARLRRRAVRRVLRPRRRHGDRQRDGAAPAQLGATTRSTRATPPSSSCRCAPSPPSRSASRSSCGPP